MDTIASGSQNKTVVHKAGNCPYSFIFGADVRAHSGGVETFTQDGGIPDFIPANDFSKEFVQNKLQGNVFLLHTDMFNKNWYTDGGIYDQLKERIHNKRLAPINFSGRDSHSSGANMKHTIEVLSEIPEFEQYISQLKKYFSVRSFWILVHGAGGEHDWHPDSFVSGATHRCILSLG